MTAPLKLVIATGIFHPEPGGPATYLYRILPELQQRGWDVRLITYSDDSPTTTYPYPVTRIPRRVLPLRLAHYALAAYPLLRRADLVYLHTLDLPLFGGRAPRVIKVVGDPAWERCVRKGWIPPTADIDDFQKRSYTSAVSAQQAARDRQMQHMDGVIVPSEYLKRMVVGWGVDEEKVHVVYNAVDLTPQPPLHLRREGENAGQPDGDKPSFGIKESRFTQGMISQSDARRQLDLDEGPLVLTAARLTAWKGVDYLITALPLVPDVRLLVAGDGPEYARLVALAEQFDVSSRVTFLGRVARERMPLYLCAADYLALYSGYEGLSHTLLESLHVGTPVIASDKGGNPEVVRHGVNGLLVPYVDGDALAAALQDAFRPGQRDSLAANAHAGLERFAFSHMVEQTAVVLRAYVR